MTAAEITALLTAKGWTQVGPALKDAKGIITVRRYQQGTRAQLFLFEAAGVGRLYQELPAERIPDVIAGKGRPA